MKLESIDILGIFGLLIVILMCILKVFPWWIVLYWFLTSMTAKIRFD